MKAMWSNAKIVLRFKQMQLVCWVNDYVNEHFGNRKKLLAIRKQILCGVGWFQFPVDCSCALREGVGNAVNSCRNYPLVAKLKQIQGPTQ